MALVPTLDDRPHTGDIAAEYQSDFAKSMSSIFHKPIKPELRFLELGQTTAGVSLKMRQFIGQLIKGKGTDSMFKHNFERFSRFWFVGLILIYLVIGILASVTLWGNKQAAGIRHQLHLIDATSTSDLSDTVSRPVMAGMYLERIFELSPRNAQWRADFYLWFRWKKGEGSETEIDLSKIQVVDGEIVRKTEVANLENKDGERYVLYRIEAVISKVFDTTRFPQEDHVLTLRIENGSHQREQIHFVPEKADSALSSRVAIPGYRIYHHSIRERPHTYKTHRGQTGFNGSTAEAVYSQLQYSIGIQREGWQLFLKMFQGVFVSVTISLMGFLINPAYNSPRISVGIGSLFAVVASTYVISQYLPQGSSDMGLTDIITSLALITIMLNLLTSTISLGLHTQRTDLNTIRRFDYTALAVFGFCYVIVNVWLALLVRM